MKLTEHEYLLLIAIIKNCFLGIPEYSTDAVSCILSHTQDPHSLELVTTRLCSI